MPDDDGGGTGPFLRSVTKDGYFCFATTVCLPRVQDISAMPSYQTKKHGTIPADSAYIYIGGWSDFRGPDDSAIDFGLQYSPANQAWQEASQFSRYNPNHDPSIHPVLDRAKLNLQPGTVVTLTFCLKPQTHGQAISNEATTAIFCAIDTPGGRVWSKTFTVSANAAWNTAGTNQYLKRMVSIAQAPLPSNDPAPDEYVGEGYWHQTWIKNVTFGEGADSTWVFRAVRDIYGRVQVPDGSLTPNYTLPPWVNGMNGTNQNNPLQGIWFHPYQADKTIWKKSGVVAAAYSTGIFRGEQDFTAGIDCRGNARIF